jgi:hypothetical protein
MPGTSRCQELAERRVNDRPRYRACGALASASGAATTRVFDAAFFLLAPLAFFAADGYECNRCCTEPFPPQAANASFR